ncbi:MAG: deoxyribodipyrimidine photo-lyase [Chlamydiales bacterium]
MTKTLSLLWFRQDLRLSDNPAVAKAADLGSVLAIYILDDCAPNLFKIGSASKIWLYYSLEKLNRSLGGSLNIYNGAADKIISELTASYPIHHIFYNQCYEPWHLKQESLVKSLCKKRSIDCQSFNGNYLWDPDQILKNDGSYYRVFHAYKNKSHQSLPRLSIEKTMKIDPIKDLKNALSIADLPLLPRGKRWYEKIVCAWQIGEVAAHNKLSNFIKTSLAGYKHGRDYPCKNQTSLLSPHLHFGEISPSQIWKAIHDVDVYDEDRAHFSSELIWREFSCYLLYHVKSLHKENFNAKFNRFPWQDHEKYFHAWKTGQTGYPIVDAGIRQLWQTGYMHNRVRMIVASFLVKNLMIHWHKGRDWFWDCLVDADLANNSASWQWVAGCGVDAAPYFRIFNPMTQGKKFDKYGTYTRQFVPELANLPDKYLFAPWTTPKSILNSAKIILGKSYPNPIVDLNTSRNRALRAYKKLTK